MPQVTVKFTGLDQLIRKFKQAPKVLNQETEKAMNQSILLIQRNVRTRTPVDTGRLRTSIGGAYGWKRVGQRVASIGTNVKYAIYVEDPKNTLHQRHSTGQRLYFKEGVKVSMSGITKFFEAAMKRVAQRLTR